MKKSITVCFPTYNEGGNIGEVLGECVNSLKHVDFKWDILVVDNDSSDDTLSIVKEFSKKHKNIGFIKHKKNLGYARSTMTSMRNAKGDIILIIDADMQHTAKDIPKFVDKINEGYDMVVGWKKPRRDSTFRVFISKIYNFVFNILFDTKYHDVDCGFRAMTKQAADRIVIKLMNVPVGAELFARAKKKRMKVAEVPVKHFARKKGKSVFIPWKMPITMINIFLSLIKLKIVLG